MTSPSVAFPADELAEGTLRRRPSKTDYLRPTYGFDDVSLAQGAATIDPADVELNTSFGGFKLKLPILAAAMDAVVDARMCGALARVGALGVLNLEGLQTRHDDPAAALERIATAADGEIQQAGRADRPAHPRDS